MPKMTKGEREELVKMLRQQTAVRKRQAEQYAAELLADAERQLATVYKADDEAWRDVTAAAQAHVNKAKAAIAKLCREKGIREEFAPSLYLSWSGRGENASDKRRGELRKVAVSRIEALRQAAFVRIEAEELEYRKLLAPDMLENKEALAFLDALPAPEALMPRIDVMQLADERDRRTA